MPLENDDVKGTTGCGYRSDEYCIHCYDGGEFTDRDMTIDKMIETNLRFLDEWIESTGIEMTEDEAIRQLREFLPTLKRWKQPSPDE
jgi:hypothetical protein